MQALFRVLVMVWLPVAAAAHDPDRQAAILATYSGWLAENNLTGTGALAYHGEVVAEIGDAHAPVEIASVSKSITALCAAALVDAGKLDFSNTVRDLLGQGPDVTVGSLVTHTSGIIADVTQPLMVLWLNTEGHRADIVLDVMVGPSGPPGEYAYNNVNYALLALVIEAAAGADYERTCHQLVLDPVGATGRASPRSAGFLSWGGWEVSPRDYARVHAYWFGQGAETGHNPMNYPHVALGDTGAFYGLGTAFRENHSGDGTYNFWHFGALCFPGLFSTGAFAVTFGGKWTVVFAYEGCPDRAARRDLDRRIGEAVYGLPK